MAADFNGFYAIDLSTGDQIPVGPWPETQCAWISMSPRGDYFLLSGRGGWSLYRMRDFKELAKVSGGYYSTVSEAQYSPDGSVVAATVDGNVLFWNLLYKWVVVQ